MTKSTVKLAPYFDMRLSKGMSIAKRAAEARRIIKHFHDKGIQTDPNLNCPIDLLWAYSAMSQRMHEMGIDETRELTDEEWDIYQGAITRASWSASEVLPYLGLLHPVFSTTADTLGTDNNYRMMIGMWFFDPDYAAPELQTLLLHEVFHPILGHYEKELDPTLTNYAGDLQINQGLLKNKNLQFPCYGPKDPKRMKWLPNARKIGMFPGKQHTVSYPGGMPDGQTFDFYYSNFLLDRRAAEQKRLKEQMQAAGSGEGSGSDGAPGQGHSQGQDQSQGQSAVQSPNHGQSTGGGQMQGDGPSGQGPDGNGQGGSGQDRNGDQTPRNGGGNGNGENRNQPNGNPWGDGDEPASERKEEPGYGEGTDPNGLDTNGKCDQLSPEQEKILDDLGVEKAGDYEKVNAKNEAIQRAKSTIEGNNARSSSGSDFASWLLDSLRPPKVNWERLMRNIVARWSAEITFGRSDYSYRRTSRREDDEDPTMIHPGMVGYEIFSVLGCDSSGSMGHDEYVAACSEIQGALKRIENSRFLCSTVDTEITNFKPVKDVHDLDIRGGGGTIMRTFYDWTYGKKGKGIPGYGKPDITALATDGFIDWPDVYAAIRRDKYTKHIIMICNKDGYEGNRKAIDEIDELRNAAVIPIYDK